MSGDVVVREGLLRLGVLAARAAAGLLWVRGPEGEWSAASYGIADGVGGDDRRLVDLVARAGGQVEVADLAGVLAGSPLLRAPWSMRWAYGTVLRDEAGGVVGAAVLLDRWVRVADRRTAMVVTVLGRQLERGFRVGDMEPTDDSRPAPSGLDPASAGPQARSMTDGPPPGPELLKAGEVAQLLDVCPRTVTNWAAQGKLPSVRTAGGQYRFRRSDLAALWSPMNASIPARHRPARPGTRAGGRRRAMSA